MLRRQVCTAAWVRAGLHRFASAGFLASTKRVRNIGISAHVDSGKTTCTERVLFYTGRIQAIHEVKGGGDIGATMDSMELEKERGITIRSAATHCKWKDLHINLIDTPGHVDFTIEVERALRVLDGAVLLMCGVGGVQSQTLTVDRQMRRYNVPRVCFVNKMDRPGANAKKAVQDANKRLNLNAAFLQVQIGETQDFEGVCDVVDRCAYYYDGKFGEKVRKEPVPAHLKEEVEATRKELVARLADVDPEIEEAFLSDQDPTDDQLHAAVRRATIANKLVPVLMGSAYKNKGVQQLLDAVEKYLPNPGEVVNKANYILPQADEEGRTNWVESEELTLENDDEKPLVAIVFKLENSKSGFSNYVRIYQGKLRRGDQLLNVRTGKTFTAAKLVRMHAASVEPVDEVKCGEICAILGDVGASSGDSVMKPSKETQTQKRIACSSMYVPPRVLARSFTAKDKNVERNALNILTDFMREDPTLWAGRNTETDEANIEGMGELHIDIYIERLKREFGVVVEMGDPTVNYREVIQKKQDFNYTHKRQSGGAGQWANVRGVIEPLPINLARETGTKNKLTLKCSNAEIRENLQKSFAKTFEQKIFTTGLLMKAPVWGVHVALTGGEMHEVDSTDLAFKACAQYLWDEFLPKLEPTLLEPWMTIEIAVPAQFFQDAQSEFNRRGGVISDSSVTQFDAVVRGEAALSNMFGFITDLRMATKGQGEFSMEFLEYRPMDAHRAQAAIDKRNAVLKRSAPFSLV
jgi:elongation factor G